MSNFWSYLSMGTIPITPQCVSADPGWFNLHLWSGQLIVFSCCLFAVCWWRIVKFSPSRESWAPELWVIAGMAALLLFVGIGEQIETWTMFSCQFLPYAICTAITGVIFSAVNLGLWLQGTDLKRRFDGRHHRKSHSLAP